MTFHEDILQILEKYRRKNPNFNYLLRQRSGAKNRLEKGYWFQGSDKYAFVGLTHTNNPNTKTKSAGLIFRPAKKGYKCEIVINFDSVKDSSLIDCYQEVINVIGGFAELSTGRYSKNIGVVNPDDFLALEIFLDKNYSLITNELRKIDRDDVLIQPEEFQKIKLIIDKKREILNRNYWLFQANPKIWDLASELEDEKVLVWRVTSHRDKIKKGDKIIIWLSGKNAGCYGIGETISEVYERSEPDSSPAVNVRIEISLADEPILWENIKKEEVLVNFKGGSQGTNFSSNKDEYYFFKNHLKESEGDDFANFIKNFDRKYVEYYLNFLQIIIKRLNLEEGDERLYFSTKRNRLSFTIGQRYCWTLFNDSSDQPFGVISKLELNETSSLYDGTGPKSFFSRIEKTPNETHLRDSIFEALNDELSRTTKSSFRNQNNQAFEKAAFNQEIDPNMEISERKYVPLNQILYGPPGTGKTYKTKELAVQIANPELVIDHNLSEKEKRNLVLEEYSRLLDNNQVAFTTFHQSFSYEDFVEGIKPVTIDGQIIYQIVPGVLKAFCHDQFYIQVEDYFGKGDKYKIVGINEKNIRIQRNSGVVDISRAFIDELTEIYLKGDIVDSDFSSAGRETLYNKMPTKWDKYLFGYESLYKALLDYIIEKKSSFEETDKPKVLIIDEINRGNVSAIFGELITLIEADKRKGAEEEISVTLPYSKQPFSVPKNLYIIGTMNTADRSVEALDTALRRRFSFLEMLPKPELIADIEIEGIKVSEILNTLNSRIEQLIDRDHTIGHSYFFHVKTAAELARVFNDKVVPLLQEYFYGDYSKIGMVLGKAFVTTSNGKNVQFAEFPIEDSVEDYISPIYSINKVNSNTVIDALQILMGKSTVVNEEA